jgi:hypothetical protein
MCVALSPREFTAQFIYFQKSLPLWKIKNSPDGRRKPEEKIGSTKTTTSTLTFVTELLFALVKLVFL